MKKLLPIVALGLLGACKHTPLPTATQDAYYSCADATLKDAERRLAKAGYPMKTVTETSVTTGVPVTELDDETPKSRRYVVAVDGENTERLRRGFATSLVLVGAEDGLTFTLYWDGEMQKPLAEEQRDHERTREALDTIRTLVCGEPFFAKS